jgi:hypothetical protein
MFFVHNCAMCRMCEKTLRLRATADLKRRERIYAAEQAAEARAIALANATPVWCDKSAIHAVYREARRLTEETGETHHVDHYYPLQGKLCCGFHVADNLRITKASENCSKSNVMPLGDSPATRFAMEELGGVDGRRAEML